MVTADWEQGYLGKGTEHTLLALGATVNLGQQEVAPSGLLLYVLPGHPWNAAAPALL
jgi:hypothetical protein